MAAPGAASVGTASFGASATVAPGAPAAAGARQYAIVSITVSTETWVAASGPADTGWTLVRSFDLTTPNANVPDRGNTQRVEIWEQTTPGTAATSWTKSGTRRFGAVRISWPGVVGAPVFSAAVQSSNTTAHTSPAVTPPANTDCKVGALAAIDQGPTPVTLTSPGAPWSSVSSLDMPNPLIAESQSLRVVEQTIPAAASPTAVSATFTTSAVEEAVLVSWVLPGTTVVATGVPFLPSALGPSGRLVVDCAWGANLAADPATWTWSDITADVRQDPGIDASLGRADEASSSQPAACSLVLDNTAGAYSLGGRSPNYPNVRRGTPVRVRIDPGDGVFRVVFFGSAVGFTPGWDSLKGTIPVVTLTAAGTLRRLAQGAAPVKSALRRVLGADPTIVAYWPFEEGDGATLAKNLRGGSDFSFTGAPDWASSTAFLGSGPLPVTKDGYFTASVAPYTASAGASQVTFLLAIPAGGIADGVVLAHIHTTGDLARFDITYEAFGGRLGVFIYARDGSLFGSVPEIAFAIDGQSRRIRFYIRQTGANVEWRLDAIEARPGAIEGGFGQTIVGRTCGIVSYLEMIPHSDGGNAAIGHVTVANTTSNLSNLLNELVAFEGEYASSSTVGAARLERVAAENGLSVTRYTEAGSILTNYDRIGPQRIAPLLDLLRDAETADQGQLWDGRDAGLSYTTRRYREQGITRLTIDAAAGELAEGFAPVDDDQRTRNRVEVKRYRGATATYEDTSGPMGTGAIGIYDSSLEVATQHDLMALQHAGWQVNLGTVEGFRFPSVTVDARVTPYLMAAALAAVPGDRIEVVNLGATLATFGTDRVSLIVEGIAHTITAAGWWVTFQCSPFGPWGIARAAATTGDVGEFVMRADSAGCTAPSGAAVGATSLSVVTAVGPRWTTAADDFPLFLDVGGRQVRATVCAGSSTTQVFTVDPLAAAVPAGAVVKLYDPRPLGL